MKKKIYINLLLLICSTIIVLLVAEFAYRGAVCIIKDTCKPRYTPSRELGWVYTPYIKEKSRQVADFGGNLYYKDHESFKYGFRAWGDISSGRQKILFVGDSITDAADVANDNTYYSVFKRSLPEDIEVFAYGGGGYGTLQEYLIIDRYIDEIGPDVVVLQFCTNDFINNSFEAESHTIALNQTLRPYLKDGKIIYRYSRWHPYPFFLKNSRLFALIDMQVQLFRFRLNKGYTKKEKKKATKVSGQSTEERNRVTLDILRMIRKRVPMDVKLYTFNCNGPILHKGAYGTFDRLATEAGIKVIHDVAGAAEEAEAAGAIVRARDGIHYNNLGNEIMGKKLAEFFEGLLNAER